MATEPAEPERKRTTRIKLVLSDDVSKELKALSDRMGPSKTDLIRNALNLYQSLVANKLVLTATEFGAAGTIGFRASSADPNLVDGGILANLPLIVLPPTSLAVGVFDQQQSSSRVEVVSNVTSDIIKRLLRDPGEIYKLSPQQFEELIMDRLAAMRYDVHQVGKTNQPDGGVDIVFRPKPGDGIPFLGAVQVKHHGKATLKSDVQVIRDMEGVLSRHRNDFNFGMVVTNTSFTAEAEWYVKPLRLFIRARDGKDVRRWIEGDFTSERENHEMPDSIELTSKLILELNYRKPK